MLADVMLLTKEGAIQVKCTFKTDKYLSRPPDKTAISAAILDFNNLPLAALCIFIQIQHKTTNVLGDPNVNEQCT